MPQDRGTGPRRRKPFNPPGGTLEDIAGRGLHLAACRFGRPLLDDAPTDAQTLAAFIASGRTGTAVRNATIPAAWFRPAANRSLDATLYHAEAVETIVTGVLAALASDWPDDNYGDRLLALALGLDDASATARQVLTGRPVSIAPPKELEPLPLAEDLTGRPDLHLVDLPIKLNAVGVIANARPTPWDAAVINSLPRGCGGETIRLEGSGFGQSKPDDVQLLFPVRSGGWSAGEIIDWHPNHIDVRLPEDVARGCAGLVQIPDTLPALVASLREFAGQLQETFGPIAAVTTVKLEQAAVQVQLPRPNCEHPSAVAFEGGLPEVLSFTINGRPGTAVVVPSTAVDVVWTVAGVDEVYLIGPGNDEPLGPYANQAAILHTGLGADGTSGRYRLTAQNQCGAVTAEVVAVARGDWALVLAGGGAKGAFEVGAARCLNALGYDFKIYVGTSVGAVNAAKLAEGTPEAVDELEDLWLSLYGTRDLFETPEWYDKLSEGMRLVLQSSTGGLDSVMEFGASLLWQRALGAAAGAFGVPGWMWTFFTAFGPVLKGVIKASELVGAVIQASAAESLFDPSPLADKIEQNIDPAKILANGKALYVTTTCLNNGQRYTVNEKGWTTPDLGTTIGLHSAILASASIPIAFPTMPLAIQFDSSANQPSPWPYYSSPPFIPLARHKYHFVDGGVQQNIPVADAVHAGASRAVAVVVPSPVFSTPTTLPASRVGLITVGGMTAEAAMWEMQRDDLRPPGGWDIPVDVIAPEFLLYDTLTVDPGLIGINMAYGYLTAFDRLEAKAQTLYRLRELTRRIVTNRFEAWHSEFSANARYTDGAISKNKLRLVPSLEALQRVRLLKRDTHAAVVERIALAGEASVPKSRADWWLEFEAHRWEPIIADPWQELHAENAPEPLPAEAPPA